MDELLADFLIETDEKLAEADRALLRLEHTPSDPAALSLAFRIVHTIKGTCGFLGLPRLEQVLHSAENVLGQVRDGALPVTPDLVTGTLHALDHARRIVAEIGSAVDESGLSARGVDPRNGAMQPRMQPIGTVWARLPRLVRHLSGELGKQIELDVRGQDTELDREVLELLRDPLTHMVRNSADHGIETPLERAAAGKPERGRIALSAYQEGGHTLISLSDDGRGLAVDRIRARARESGLATEAELAAMSDSEVQQFIFRAGFSTASAVTMVSGRGVGLDVVRANVERVRGAIDVSSRSGEGTTFTIRLPDAPATGHSSTRAGEYVRPTLLVVEDSHLFRLILLPALSASGFEVMAVGGVGDALALLDTGMPFDVIVSDIEMPDMDGLAFARRVRAGACARLPMVALSGRSGVADVEAALAAGFTEHVTKFDRDELVMALRRCLVASA